MKYGPQSDNDQFVYTDDVEKYLEDNSYFLNCQICKIPVPFLNLHSDKEKKSFVLEVKCHGNGLKFHLFEKKVFKVDEML